MVRLDDSVVGLRVGQTGSLEVISGKILHCARGLATYMIRTACSCPRQTTLRGGAPHGCPSIVVAGCQESEPRDAVDTKHLEISALPA